MQSLPRGKRLPGLWGPLFIGVDEELRCLPAAPTPKAGLIIWSSTVCFIEMLSLILSPASNASSATDVFQARTWRVGDADLFTYHAGPCTLDRMILYEYRCGGAWKKFFYAHIQSCREGQRVKKCYLIAVVLSFNGVLCYGHIEVDSLFPASR